MAGDAECNSLLEPSSWHFAPANGTKSPVISNIPPSVPFSDWACPSLPEEKFIDKISKQDCAITQFLDISAYHNHLVLDSRIQTVHNHVHSLPNASAAKKIHEVSGRLSRHNSSTFTNSLAEQSSVLTSSVSRNKTGNFSTKSEFVNDDSSLQEQKNVDVTSLALSTIPTLNFLCENDSQVFKKRLSAEACHIQAFDQDLRCTSVTADLPLERELSESGWTAYFDISSGDWTTSYESILALNDIVGEKVLATHHRRNVSHQKQKLEHSEDSSVVSDASSGPERPIEDGYLVAADFSTDVHSSLKRYLDDAAMENSETSHSRQAKLRRIQNMEIEVPLSLLLEDTATSPLQQSAYGMELCGRETSGKCHDETRSAAMKASSEWQSETIYNRIGELQALVPNSMELSQEDMLKVTVEYVRALELKVKMYDNPVLRSGNRSSPLDLVAAHSAGGCLLEKGLCLMPLVFSQGAMKSISTRANASVDFERILKRQIHCDEAVNISAC